MRPVCPHLVSATPVRDVLMLGSPGPLQVDTLCLEDLHAFIAQALCLQGKSAAQLADLQVRTRLTATVPRTACPMEGQRSGSLCVFQFGCVFSSCMVWLHLSDGCAQIPARWAEL